MFLQKNGRIFKIKLESDSKFIGTNKFSQPLYPVQEVMQSDILKIK